ncbi:hypothetical protein BS329_00520 [Amycolatopsis coloradensis]|uniref:Uncharacterized protein n=1 Tax=Amycolatopsis coloradensis TaxID=76021 RepID=A0A1R0L3B7_9PSEU|nr:hypothetical protein [Amycolatopsis coloradensis]OLZ57207.1 hypothetical protein BS329_00520 [Amycolatopsis coloradensis]
MTRLRKHWLWPLVISVLALIAFAGLGLLTRAVLGSRGNRALADTGEFGVWSLLIGASAVLFAFLFAHSVHLTAWRRLAGVALWKPALAYGIFAAILFAFQWKAGSPIGDLKPTTAIGISRTLLALGLIAAAPAVLGLWLNHTRLRRISRVLDGETRARADDVLGELLDCKRANEVCLTVLALIVSTAVIDAGAQRRAFLATGTPKEAFPAESVLLYGALFTAISLLLYVPVFLAWKTRSVRLVDEIYPLPRDARPTEDWLAGRARLTQLLGTDATVGKTVTVAFGILAPLAVSALSVAIPGLK